MRWNCAICLSVCCGLPAACTYGPQADYGKLGLVEVSGTITLDGQPLSQAAVFFINEADSTHSYGVTDQAGHYTLMLDSRKSGVIPGLRRVQIATDKNPLGDSGFSGQVAETGEEEDPDAAPKRSQNEKVPACYNERSKLKVEVTDNDTKMDFELKSDCTTVSAT
jgi:hypothetical protein